VVTGPTPAEFKVRTRELIPFFAAALIGLLSVLLPGPETDWTLYAFGAGLTVLIAVAGLVAVRLQRGSWLILGGSLAYLVAVALLRHSGIQQAAGYVPLMLLPQAADVAADTESWSDEAGPEPALTRVLAGVRRLLVEPSLPTGAAFLMRACAPGLELDLDPGLVAALRERKQPDEVAALREAGRLADEMVAWVAAEPLAGLTERQLSGRMQARFLEQGQRPHPDYIVATGANAALPHHETSDTPIDPRAPLLLDFGCLVEGYHSDITRVLLPDDVGPGVEEAYDVVLAAHDAALAAVAPSVPCEAVDRAARDVIAAAGHGERFLHRTGHGLGLEIHEPPYLRAGNPQPLETGHVFSIEPGIYLAGRHGARIEDIVVCTTDGVERLNLTTRDPVVLDG